MSRRTAAALLVTRDRGGIEVFLAERAPELRFFGGYLALPGGTLAPEDRDGAADEREALLRCAHRELFEELGLLRATLPAGRAEPGRLAAARTAMLAAERAEQAARQDGAAEPSPPASPWSDLVADAALPPLRELCRIETPAFAPVRYDTVFFHVDLADCTAGTRSAGTADHAGDRGAAGVAAGRAAGAAAGGPTIGGAIQPDVWPGELTGGAFWRPADALLAWRRGELLLVPPVVILLEHLAATGDFDAFARDLASTASGYAQGRLHQVRFSPGIVLAPLRTPTLPPATTTNCYVVGHDELWVVDPGSPDDGEQRRLLALLDELCRPRADGTTPRLAGILSTHHHPDHVGGLAALCAARGLRVRGHPRTLERLPAGTVLGEPLHDGGRIALGRSPDGRDGWTLTALHTPGHDQGHLCFEESRYGTAVVGDMLSTISTIIVDPPEGHLATYLQSLEALAQRPLTTLYPAHGPAMRDGGRLVKQYLRHRRQRESSLLQALQATPGTAEQLLPKVYWDADPKLYGFAARSLLAGLQKLHEEGRAAVEDGVWRATGS